jgi:hypothetical protein
MKIERTFVARATTKRNWSGDIGRIEMETDCAKISLNGKAIPPASVEYLLNFALQAFQDAYAGAESLAEAQGNFAKKIDAVVAGTLGMRGAGESDEEKIGMKLVRQRVGKDATDAYVKTVFEKNREKLQSAIKDEITRLAKVAEDRRKAAAKVSGMELDF